MKNLAIKADPTGILLLLDTFSWQTCKLSPYAYQISRSELSIEKLQLWFREDIEGKFEIEFQIYNNLFDKTSTRVSLGSYEFSVTKGKPATIIQGSTVNSPIQMQVIDDSHIYFKIHEITDDKTKTPLRFHKILQFKYT